MIRPLRNKEDMRKQYDFSKGKRNKYRAVLGKISTKKSPKPKSKSTPPESPKIKRKKCIMCAKSIKPLHKEYPYGNESCLNDGGMIELHFGYGSRHDTDYLVGVICDECAFRWVQRLKSKMTFHSPLGRKWPNTVQGDGPKEYRARAIEAGITFATAEEMMSI